MLKTIPARLLIRPERFDLLAKIVYCKYHKFKIRTYWHVNLYKQHILVFNGGWEYPGTKKHVDQFILYFNKLIESIKNTGFDQQKSVVQVAKNGVIINGSHRVAICYVYDKNLTVSINMNKQNSTIYDYNFFRTHKLNIPIGLTEKWSDPMALEYCKIIQETKMIVFFPRINFHEKETEQILNSYGKIVYKKQFNLNQNGLLNLINELYYEEQWDKSAKAKLCYGSNNVRIYVFHPNQQVSLDNIVSMKARLRDIYKIGNHSVHINDTCPETIRIAKFVLNNDTIDFSNKANTRLSGNSLSLFSEFYQHYLDLSQEQQDSIIIDASFVMNVWGIRNARDIDFLTSSVTDASTIQRLVTPGKIDHHNDEFRKYSDMEIDDLVYNPNQHFYWHGVKFLTLTLLKKFKRARNEPKDINDIKLIDDYLSDKG